MACTARCQATWRPLQATAATTVRQLPSSKLPGEAHPTHLRLVHHGQNGWAVKRDALHAAAIQVLGIGVGAGPAGKPHQVQRQGKESMDPARVKWHEAGQLKQTAWRIWTLSVTGASRLFL